VHRKTFLTLTMLLLGCSYLLAQDWPPQKLSLPESKYGVTMQLYANDLAVFSGDRTHLQDVYSIDDTYIITNMNTSPSVDMGEIRDELGSGYGYMSWGTHGNGVGSAVVVFEYSAAGQNARTAYYNELLSGGEYTSLDIYESEIPNYGYHIGLRWSKWSSLASFSNGIVVLIVCHLDNASTLNKSKALTMLGLHGTSNSYTSDMETFAKHLARKEDGKNYWSTAARANCTNLHILGNTSSGFSTAWPGLKTYPTLNESVWVPTDGGATIVVTLDSEVNTGVSSEDAYTLYDESNAFQKNSVWTTSDGFTQLHITLQPIPGRVFGNGNILLENANIRSNGYSGDEVTIQGNYELYCYISSTPGADIVGFEVASGTGRLTVAGEYGVYEYIIRGSDTASGPWEEVLRIPASALNEYVFPASGYAYYNVQAREEETGVPQGVIRTYDTVPAGLWMTVVERFEYSEQEAFTILESTKQHLILTEGRPELPIQKTNPELTIHVMAPQTWYGGMDYYQWMWETLLDENVEVHIHNTDPFWAGTQNPDVYLANEKSHMASLQHQGQTMFLFCGSTMLENEFNTLWPEENGWRELQDSYIGYTAPHELNVNPSPSLEDSRLRRIGHGGFGPYMHSDWLKVDFNNDGWPDEGYAVSRFPFDNNQASPLLLMNKLMTYTSAAFVNTPFPTVQWLIGDMHHQTNYDGLEAQAIANRLQELVRRWTTSPSHPPLLESHLPSDPARTQRTLELMQENWASIFIGVSSTSHRYKLANFFLESYFNLGGLNSDQSSLPILALFTCDTTHFGWPRHSWYGTSFNVDLLGVNHYDGPIAIVGPNDWSHALPNGEFAALVSEQLMDGKRLAFAIADALQEYRAMHPDDNYRLFNALKTHVLGCGAITPRVRVNNMTNVGNTPLPTTLHNYPNPFNPVTTIKYNIIVDGEVDLCVYNVRGELVIKLVHENQLRGVHEVRWDGTDAHGRPVPSGVYTYRLNSAGATASKKMTLVK